MNESNNLWGLPKDSYNKMVHSHSKANIFLWIIGGVVYSLINNSLFSLATILLFIPGIFILSFASIPTFWIDLKKKQMVSKTNNILVLVVFTVWAVIDLVYPIILSILFIKVVNYIF